MRGMHPALHLTPRGLATVDGPALNLYAIEKVEDEFSTNFGKPLLVAGYTPDVQLDINIRFE